MNRIPKTEISVSPVTLGTMTFGSPVAFDDAVKLTQYALLHGINHIDTANMYEGYNRVAGSAGGVAEEIVGAAIHGMPMDEWKARHQSEATPEQLARMEESLRKNAAME